MRKLRNGLLAAAGVALLGGAALAASEESHVLNVVMPDGAVAQVHYVGDAAPRVVVRQTQAVPVAVVPMRALPVALADPFAGFDRMAAMMDAQMAAMMRQVAAMQARAAAAPQRAQMVASGKAPAGVQFSYVSTTTSRNGCTTSVRWSSDGSGAEPKMIKTSSGDCAGGNEGTGGAPAATATKASAPADAAKSAKPAPVKAIPDANRI
jgi:hypothetical protein